MLIAGTLAGGAWLAALLGYSALAARGWPATDLPPRYRIDLVRSFSPLGPVATAVFAFLAPLLLVLAWARIERWLRLDPAHAAFESFRWTLRVLARRPALLLLAGFLLLTLLGLWLQPLALVVACLLAALWVPFAVLRPEVASAPDGGSWWRPRWPGARPVLSALLLIALADLLALALGNVAGGQTLRAAIVSWILQLPVDVLIPPAVAAVFLFRWGPREALRRLPSAFHRDKLGPCVAFAARFCYPLLLVSVPFALATILLWKNVPVAAQWLAGTGREMSPLAYSLLGAANFVSGVRAALVLALPASIFSVLATGRLVWLLRSAGITPTPAVPEATESPE